MPTRWANLRSGDVFKCTPSAPICPLDSLVLALGRCQALQINTSQIDGTMRANQHRVPSPREPMWESWYECRKALIRTRITTYLTRALEQGNTIAAWPRPRDPSPRKSTP